MQLSKLKRLRAYRNQGRVHRSLDQLREAAARTDNTMPYILDAVRASATVGEICEALRDVFGSYQESSGF